VFLVLPVLAVCQVAPTSSRLVAVYSAAAAAGTVPAVPTKLVAKAAAGGKVEFSQLVGVDASAVLPAKAPFRALTLESSEFAALDATGVAARFKDWGAARITELQALAAAWRGATFKADGYSLQFEFAPRTAGLRGTATKSSPTFTFSILRALAGIDTPLQVTTVISREELQTMFGVNALLGRRSATTIYMPKTDANCSQEAKWRFSAFGKPDEDTVCAEVVATVDAEKVFDVQRGTEEPNHGVTVAYNFGDGQPIYIGLSRRIAGRLSLTAGSLFGGGESPSLGFGASYSILDIADLFGDKDTTGSETPAE